MWRGPCSEKAPGKGQVTQAERTPCGAPGHSWATCRPESRTQATWHAFLAPAMVSLAYAVDGVAVAGRRTACNKQPYKYKRISGHIVICMCACIALILHYSLVLPNRQRNTKAIWSYTFKKAAHHFQMFVGWL